MHLENFCIKDNKKNNKKDIKKKKNNKIKSSNLKKGGIILDDIYYGKCIHPNSLLKIYDNRKLIEINIENLYNKYCKNNYDFDGLGYWYKTIKDLYIESFNIEKLKKFSKKIIYLYKQKINENIKIIKLINGNEIICTMNHKLCISKNNKLKWENYININDEILCYNNDTYELIKIKEIIIKQYNGYVYDLKIAKSKNYFTNNILVHNTSNNILDINKYKNYLIIVSNYRLNYWKNNIKNNIIINNKNDLINTKKNNIIILKKNFDKFSCEFNNNKKYRLICDYDNFDLKKGFYNSINNIKFKIKWFIINNYYKTLNKKKNLLEDINTNILNFNKIIIKNDNFLKNKIKMKFRYLKFTDSEREHYKLYINKFNNIYKNNNILFEDDDYLKKYCCFPNKNININTINFTNLNNNDLINNLDNYKKIIINKFKTNDLNCSICLNEINKNNLGITKCGHIFCYSCIYKSLKINNKCPTCRRVNEIDNIYLYTDKNDKINYNVFNDLGTKFRYLFKMIDNLKTVIIFSNYNDNLYFIQNFLKKLNINSEFLKKCNNTSNILLVNYNNDLRFLEFLNKKYYLIFLSPYYNNYNLLNENYLLNDKNKENYFSRLKYLDIFNNLDKNILDIYFLIMKNSIENSYISNIKTVYKIETTIK